MNVLEDLLKTVEADLHLVKRDLLGRTDPIRAALEAYERAVQEEAALAYCRDHSLKRPSVVGRSKLDAARALLATVTALPELEPQGVAPALSPEAAKVEPPVDAGEDDVTRAFRARFPHLAQAAQQGKLLVIGAFAGRTKSLPGPLGPVTEWIDTAHDGTRQVQSATKRIRSGHVFAVLVCEQAISHQHAEPITDAARASKTPLGYAGKGGNASLARALESLEKLLP